jgi:hypothetical protein
MSRGIRSFYLEGPAGRLEALLNPGAAEASHAAVVCHPHPLFGGTLHNKVVFRAMKALHGFGFPVLRFNFRGTGLSAGDHDQGRGEVEDVRAAVTWLEAEFHLPIVFAGFSFGAWVGLRACCPDPRVAALLSLGTPVGVEGQAYAYDFLRQCPKPKLFVSGERDEFGPPGVVERVVEAAAEPKRLVRIPGADHFFEGRLPALEQAIEAWLHERFSPG